MRILLWAPFGAGEHYWGPGTSAFRLYKHLDKTKHTVILVHSNSDQKLYPEVYVDQIQISDLGRSNLFSKIRYFVLSYLWIKKNHQKFDVFHGISAFEYTFRPALYFKKFGKPVFIKLTGNFGGFGQNSFLSRILGISYSRKINANRIDGYIALSESIKKNLLNCGIESERIFNIPNGVDTFRFKPVSIERRAEICIELNVKNIFTISYIGGLTENKRVIQIVEAINSLSKTERNLKFQLLLVGPDRSDGIIKNSILEYIGRYRLEDIVHLIEHTNQPELFLQISDVFILNSKQEGMSNSLLEAMSSGVPCIVTPISGSVDLINDGINGRYTDGTPSTLARILKDIIDNDEIRSQFSKESRKSIIHGYSSESIIEKHIEIFTSKMNSSGKSQ